LTYHHRPQNQPLQRRGFAVFYAITYKFAGLPVCLNRLEFVAMFDRVIGNDLPINPNAALKLKNAIAFETSGRYESAITALDEALAIQGNYLDAWLVKGVIFGKLGKCSDALKCYDKALEINPRNVDAIRLKGATFTSMGSFEKALECYLKAVEDDPANLNLHLSLAGAYQKLKRFDEAFNVYQDLKRRHPTDPKIDYLVGVMWGNRADYEKALVSFEVALRMKPDFTDAMLGKGLMLAKLGRAEEAKACANQLLEIKGAQEKPAQPQHQQETAMSKSQNEEIRSQFLAAQKKFTSQYAPSEK
jgi:tetratricopeptide (TPR) repeat protein